MTSNGIRLSPAVVDTMLGTRDQRRTDLVGDCARVTRRSRDDKATLKSARRS